MTNSNLPITLDSGATVSYITFDMVKTLGVQIQKNSQLAMLADKKTRMASMGEIDIEVQIGMINVRLRALVMENLQAVCFGGTTFHRDNNITADVNTGEIKIHGLYTVRQSNPVQNNQVFPPSRLCIQVPQCASTQITCIPGEERVAGNRPPTINIPMSQVALPTESLQLKLTAEVANLDMIAIVPRFDNTTHKDWPPQICEVVNGSAVYVNGSKIKSIAHPKHAHFQTLPVKQLSMETAKQITSNTPRKKIVGSVISSTELLDQIKVNKDALSDAQQKRLGKIHSQNKEVFNGDLTTGYNQEFGRHYGSFSFKDQNKPPPTKVWAPQYNRTCADLHQAKCDELEEQGVLIDPKEQNIDILHVSPSFIQQKGRAKHKKLRDCSLDEVRFITGFNVLNEDIKPVTGRSTSAVDIFKFLGKWKYFIFADFCNSYFQIPMAKRLWGYLGIMTPFRGIKIITRAGQGLLNSDYELDQLLFKVLGDEITDGKCMAARDDLTIGGNTVDEAISNWEEVLVKLRRCNLKISPHKVRAFLPDTEVYGYRIKNGKVAPSQHIITNLGKTNIEDLKTVKQINSWKGLYKTLIGHLPHLAHFMSPFDQATASKESKSKFDWTPQLTSAFNAAIKQLDQINETYLPHPDDQLILKPDTAKVPLCTGWTLYAIVDSKELPVHYCSAKLPSHMSNWFPCELEAVGAVLAIDQCSPWINESNLTTLVGPDSMPVVKAAQMMKIGRHSKNPRLQQLLTSVNRRNIRFYHNSAKAGYHIAPDTLSRLNRSCGAKDCAVERFLSDIPVQVECMSVNALNECTLDNITDIILPDMDPCMLAATSADLAKMLLHSPGSIPLGSRKAWRDVQQSDQDCREVYKLKTTGNLPVKKKTNPIINRLFKECVVEDGLLVVRMFDRHLMREVGRVVVPPNLLNSILTAIHLRLLHPTGYQMQIIFDKYFFSIGVKQSIEDLLSNCFICIGLKKFPKELQDYNPKLFPDQPGSHMNLDIMKRSGQMIVVNTDLFSGYTTACFTPSEQIDDIAMAILQLITPIRHSHMILVRVDQQSSLKSIMKNGHETLDSNGIKIVLGEDFNKNSNCCVDKRIQELERELKVVSPAGEKISAHQLAKIVTCLNNRNRNQDLSAAEIHFSRDSVRGVNLQLDDKKLRAEKIQMREVNHPYSAKSKAPKGKPSPSTEISTGDMVFIKSQGSKHEARSPFLVTGTGAEKITMRKMLNTQPERSRPLTISSEEKLVDRKFLFKPRQRRAIAEITESEGDEYEDHQIETLHREHKSFDWIPTSSYECDDDNLGYSVIYHNDVSVGTDDEASVTQQAVNQEDDNIDLTDNSDDIEVESNDEDMIVDESDQESLVPDEDGEEIILNQPRRLVKGDLVSVFDNVSDSWRTVKLTSNQIKYYRKEGPYYNCRFSNGEERGFYFILGESWSLIEQTQDDVPDQVHQVDGGVTPDSLTPEDSPAKVSTDQNEWISLDESTGIQQGSLNNSYDWDNYASDPTYISTLSDPNLETGLSERDLRRSFRDRTKRRQASEKEEEHAYNLRPSSFDVDALDISSDSTWYGDVFDLQHGDVPVDPRDTQDVSDLPPIPPRSLRSSSVIVCSRYTCKRRIEQRTFSADLDARIRDGETGESIVTQHAHHPDHGCDQSLQ